MSLRFVLTPTGKLQLRRHVQLPLACNWVSVDAAAGSALLVEGPRHAPAAAAGAGPCVPIQLWRRRHDYGGGSCGVAPGARRVFITQCRF